MKLAQGHRGEGLGPLVTTGRTRAGDRRNRRAWAEGKAGRGLGPHLGLRWRWRRPWGSRTQGCEQHGPPQDEVPLRREEAGQQPGHGKGQPSNKCRDARAEVCQTSVPEMRGF